MDVALLKLRAFDPPNPFIFACLVSGLFAREGTGEEGEVSGEEAGRLLSLGWS